MIRVKNSFLEVIDDGAPRPRARHRSVDVIPRLEASFEPPDRGTWAPLGTRSDAVPREVYNSEAGDNSESERTPYQPRTTLPSTLLPQFHQEPSAFHGDDNSEVGGNCKQERIPVSSSPHPASMPQPWSLQGSAASSGCGPLQMDRMPCSSEVEDSPQQDDISIEPSPHPSSMPQPLSLHRGTASSGLNMHMDWLPCSSEDDDSSYAERISVGSSPCPPRMLGNPAANRFSGEGDDAVHKSSMPETWEVVTDEPWEHLADDEDSFSTSNHNRNPNSSSCAREQTKNYPGRQTPPFEKLAWERIASKMAAKTESIARERQELQQTCVQLRQLLEKMRKEVGADDGARTAVRPLYHEGVQQVNRNIANWVQVNRNLFNLVQSQLQVIRTRVPDAPDILNPNTQMQR